MERGVKSRLKKNAYYCYTDGDDDIEDADLEEHEKILDIKNIVGTWAHGMVQAYFFSVPQRRQWHTV
jgi:hypothetical protein